LELKGILKWPLLLAAVVVVLRVIVERAGAPAAVSNVLSIVALHTVLGPLYFAIRIGSAGPPRPYFTLIKLVGLYAVCTRAMIIPIYWMARIFNWSESRFGGLSGSTPITGFIFIPFATGAFWIMASLVFGSAFGMVVVAIMRALHKPQIA
jgi:hypothetical protein